VYCRSKKSLRPCGDACVTIDSALRRGQASSARLKLRAGGNLNRNKTAILYRVQEAGLYE
jgi:hypothetical protein